MYVLNQPKDSISQPSSILQQTRILQRNSSGAVRVDHLTLQHSISKLSIQSTLREQQQQQQQQQHHQSPYAQSLSDRIHKLTNRPNTSRTHRPEWNDSLTVQTSNNNNNNTFKNLHSSTTTLYSSNSSKSLNNSSRPNSASSSSNKQKSRRQTLHDVRNFWSVDTNIHIQPDYNSSTIRHKSYIIDDNEKQRRQLVNDKLDKVKAKQAKLAAEQAEQERLTKQQEEQKREQLHIERLQALVYSQNKIKQQIAQQEQEKLIEQTVELTNKQNKSQRLYQLQQTINDIKLQTIQKRQLINEKLLTEPEYHRVNCLRPGCKHTYHNPHFKPPNSRPSTAKSSKVNTARQFVRPSYSTTDNSSLCSNNDDNTQFIIHNHNLSIDSIHNNTLTNNDILSDTSHQQSHHKPSNSYVLSESTLSFPVQTYDNNHQDTGRTDSSNTDHNQYNTTATMQLCSDEELDNLDTYSDDDDFDIHTND